jgi:GNAT superfamily N-acetyltransferase
MMRPIRRSAHVHEQDGRRYEIDVAHYYDHVRARAYVLKGRKRRPVGRAYLDKVGDEMLQAPDVLDATLHVDEMHRRRGIATALYGAAERSTGRRCIPSQTLTKDGAAFWARFRARTHDDDSAQETSAQEAATLEAATLETKARAA